MTYIELKSNQKWLKYETKFYYGPKNEYLANISAKCGCFCLISLPNIDGFQLNMGHFEALCIPNAT